MLGLLWFIHLPYYPVLYCLNIQQFINFTADGHYEQ